MKDRIWSTTEISTNHLMFILVIYFLKTVLWLCATLLCVFFVSYWNALHRTIIGFFGHFIARYFSSHLTNANRFWGFFGAFALHSSCLDYPRLSLTIVTQWDCLSVRRATVQQQRARKQRALRNYYTLKFKLFESSRMSCLFPFKSPILFMCHPGLQSSSSLAKLIIKKLVRSPENSKFSLAVASC